jgi:PAS domain S-box-containing protein
VQLQVVSRIRSLFSPLVFGSALLVGLVLNVGVMADGQDPAVLAPWVFVADQEYPPLSSLVDGQPQGLDVDLVRELSRVLGREIRLELLPYGEAQRRVLAGEAEALTDLGIMPERRALFDFSEATITHEFGFFVRRTDTSVRGLADLAGKRVGVTTSPFVPGFLERQSDAQLVPVTDFADGFARLVTGELDVLAYDSWVAAPMARQHLGEVTLVGVPFATNATAIAVKKGRRDLLDEINRGIRQLKADGTLQRLEAKWRPREMLFLSETLVERAASWVAGGVLLVLSVAMAAWVVSLKREIRRRERLESALAVSESSFATAFRNSPDGMAIVDLDSLRFVDVNQRLAEATGYAIPELVGRTTAELGLILNTDRALGARQALATEGEAREVELRVRRKDGTTRLVVGSAGRIDVAGRPCALWALRDVTETREVEDRLRQSQKMDAVGRLAAGVAHDFNNLLTVILGNCEVGAPFIPDGNRARAALDDIRVAAERAASLTGQLLAFSRRQVLAPLTVDLNAAVRDAQPLLGRLIGEDIAIDLVLDGDAGCLQIDPGQLQQVLMNLAVNARDAMPDGGRLRFATARLADRLCLEVSDTGSGIGADLMAHVFEPFFTTKGEGQGTGLGLATVYGIVTATGGAITVDSTPGHGARFRLVWPRLANPPAAPSAASVVPAPAQAVAPARLLLVEDEADLRDMLVTYLEQMGYTVLDAESGEGAVALFDAQTEPIDLLITDVVMTGMNGRQLAQALASRQPGLPVLFLSGYTDDVILKRGVFLAGDSFMQKPFALAAFASTVRQVIDRSRASTA